MVWVPYRVVKIWINGAMACITWVYKVAAIMRAAARAIRVKRFLINTRFRVLVRLRNDRIDTRVLHLRRSIGWGVCKLDKEMSGFRL